MFVKPLNYLSTSRRFMGNAWGHGKFMASKFDSVMRQGMNVYSAVKPIVAEAAQMYGSTSTKRALNNIDRSVDQASQRYQGVRDQASKGSSIVARLAGAIGGY